MAGTKAWTLIALAASACLAWAAEPDGGYMLPGDKVAGTLAGGSDRRMVAFAGVAGSKLSAKVVAAKGSALVPRLELIAPDGALAEVGDTNPSSKRTAAFKKIGLGATGVWRLRLSSDTAAGGAYVLSARASVPLSARWTGTIPSADVPADHPVEAAPGGTISISVKAGRGGPVEPVIELVAPSGTVAGSATGAKGRVRLYAPLDQLGTYVVRVRGEPGDFSATAKIKPALKRSRTFLDVASRPDIASVSPESAPDDSRVTFTANGVGFGERQNVALVGAAGLEATAPLTSSENTKATASIDLAGVPPGAYTFRVTTAEGGSSDAPEKVTVTNRAPTVSAIDPPEAWGRYPFDAEVRGVGVDAGAKIRVLVSATGAEVPLEVLDPAVTDRTRVRLSPVVRTTGPCDVEITDPDGRSNTAAGALDLLGFKIDPPTVRSLDSTNFSYLALLAATHDDDHERVLLGIYDNPKRAAFLLCDAATLGVVDTLEVATESLELLDVAWDGVGHTFALGIRGKATSGDVYVRIVSDADLHQTISETTPTTANARGVALAAAADTGGYMVVWREIVTGGVNEVRAKTFSADGTPDSSLPRVVGAADYVNEPDVAWRSPGRYVVAYPAPSDAEYHGGLFAATVDADGYVVSVPVLVASSIDWDFTSYPQIAQAPGNGATLINFTYGYRAPSGQFVDRPVCVRLAPGTLVAGPAIALDAPVDDPTDESGGLSFNAVWDPARGEFVSASALDDGAVLIRRIGADGTPRPAAVPELFIGYTPVLYAGAAAGSLGLGVSDAVALNPGVNPILYRLTIEAAPYR